MSDIHKLPIWQCFLVEAQQTTRQPGRGKDSCQDALTATHSEWTQGDKQSWTLCHRHSISDGCLEDARTSQSTGWPSF